MSDSLSATYLTVDPSGAVNAEFTGVIHAEPGSQIEAEALTGQISGTQIKDESISTPKLAANAVTAAKIQAETITSGQIAAGTIIGNRIAAETITGTNIKAGTITAGKLSVTELSAITANLGTMTAGTIVGATIKTATSGARVEITGAGIKGINAAAVTKFNFDTTTGILSATAVISAEEGSTIPTKVLSGQIKETQIENEAISTPLLKANAVTAAKISVGTLSAISANLGTVTAGTIEGLTIKGSTIEALKALKLPVSGTEAGATENKTQWVDALGAVYAEMFAWNKSPTTSLLLGVDPGLLRGTYAKLETKVGNLSVTLFDSEGNSQFPALLGVAANRTLDMTAGNVVLFGSGEVSKFLQLTSNAKRKINFGTVEIEFPGGSFRSNIKEVEHGLGTTPLAVVATPEDDGRSIGTSAYGATKFSIRAQAVQGESPAAGTKVKTHWVAIG